VAEWQESLGSNLLVPVDPASGQALAGYEPISLGQAIYHAFSPDRNILAVVGFESSEHPKGGTLHLIDLRTWEDRTQELELEGYVNAIAFSPDGKQLAIAHSDIKNQVLILDVSNPSAKSKTAARQTLLDFFVHKLKFSADGSGLMVYGTKIENHFTVNEASPESPVAVLFDSTDLSVRWEADLAGVHHGILPKDGSATADMSQPGQAIYLYPGLAFAPQQDVLYVVHADEDKLTTVDFGARKVRTAEIKPRLSWMERLLSLTAGVAHAKVAEGTSKVAVVSPDGQLLYIVGQRNDLIQDKNGNWQMIPNPLGLQIVRTEDGSRLSYNDTEASDLSISTDGRYLYLRDWGEGQNSAWTEVFDTSTNQSIARMEGMWLVPTRRANGAPVMASSVWLNDKGEHKNVLVDSQSVLAEWISPDYLAWLTTQ
jgi:dipeptidyl aminopeptidase/acylaminoacyl peptidase